MLYVLLVVVDRLCGVGPDEDEAAVDSCSGGSRMLRLLSDSRWNGACSEPISKSRRSERACLTFSIERPAAHSDIAECEDNDTNEKNSTTDHAPYYDSGDFLA